MYLKNSVAAFIEQEVHRPSKQWIANIIAGDQEKEQVILRTEEFVLLPDTERVNRYWRSNGSTSSTAASTPATSSNHVSTNTGVARGRNGANHVSSTGSLAKGSHKMTLNWLSIIHDLSVRTLRDLRGKHIPVLRRMLDESMAAIETHAGIPRDQVMAYVHYPPSVYQLHVHFSYPYGQYCHRDAYRVHSLPAIINNLEIDSEYYAKATLHLAMYRQSLHYLALSDNTATGEDKDKKRTPYKETSSSTGPNLQVQALVHVD